MIKGHTTGCGLGVSLVSFLSSNRSILFLLLFKFPSCVSFVFPPIYYSWSVEDYHRCTHVPHNQLEEPLPFKIIYTDHYNDFESNIGHCTLPVHAMSCCYCWLYLYKSVYTTSGCYSLLQGLGKSCIGKF